MVEDFAKDVNPKLSAEELMVSEEREREREEKKLEGKREKIEKEKLKIFSFSLLRICVTRLLLGISLQS